MRTCYGCQRPQGASTLLGRLRVVRWRPAFHVSKQQITTCIQESHSQSVAAVVKERRAVRPQQGPTPPFTQLLQSPSAYIGPLAVVSIDGKGKGVIANRHVLPGDLLLGSAPLAIVEATGAPPTADPLPVRCQSSPVISGLTSEPSSNRNCTGCSNNSQSPVGSKHYAPAMSEMSAESAQPGETPSVPRSSPSCTLPPNHPHQPLMPGAVDLVNLLRLSRLSQHQSRLLAALFSGNADQQSQEATEARGHLTLCGEGSDGVEKTNTAFVAVNTASSDCSYGSHQHMQLAGLSASAGHGEATLGPICGLLLPDGELRVLDQQQHPYQQCQQQEQQQQQAPLASGHVPGAVSEELGSPVNDESYSGAVVFNCYGEPVPDRLLDELLSYSEGPASADEADSNGSSSKRSSSSGGFVGLWADFAMLNHSCCPNTINMVGGPHRHMLVRATERIPAGGEVTICYFGRELLAPRSVRAAATRGTHAFECGCARCEFERSLGPRVETALQTLYDKVNEVWGPRVGERSSDLEHVMEELEAVMVAGDAAARAPNGGNSGGDEAGAPTWWPFKPQAVASCSGGGGRETSGAKEGVRAEAQVEAVVSSVVREASELVRLVEAAVADVEAALVRERKSRGQPQSGGDGNGDAATAGGCSGPRELWWLRASMYDALELRVALSELRRDAVELLLSRRQAGGSGRRSLLGPRLPWLKQQQQQLPQPPEGLDLDLDLDLDLARKGVLQATTACLEVLAEVAPGTTLHVQLAARVEAERRAMGVRSQVGGAESHAEPLTRALAARYGPLDDEILSRLRVAAQADYA